MRYNKFIKIKRDKRKRKVLANSGNSEITPTGAKPLAIYRPFFPADIFSFLVLGENGWAA